MAIELREEDGGSPALDEIRAAQRIWSNVLLDMRKQVSDRERALTGDLEETLREDLLAARQDEQDRFLARQGELSTLIQQSTIQRLENEIAAMRTEADQGLLFDQERSLEGVERSIEEKEAEIRRRTTHYEELRAQLTRERERVIDHILPKRFTLRCAAQVFPVAVEIRLPREGGAA